MTDSPTRQVVPVRESFFCDGAWYVLASSSLGGSGLSAAELGAKLQEDDPAVIARLLTDGVCFPLHFPGDCALDDAVIIVGDLTEEEEQEWIGRIRSKLEIPCGEFMLMGGGLDEDFEVALPNAEAPDPHFVFFQKVSVPPGTYLVELYSFLGSMPVNFAWEELPEDAESFEEWWKRTRVDQPEAEWISFFNEEEYVDSEDFDLLEHIIRIAPLTETVPPPLQDEDYHWCVTTEFRRPPLCPVGVSREKYGQLP